MTPENNTLSNELCVYLERLAGFALPQEKMGRIKKYRYSDKGSLLNRYLEFEDTQAFFHPLNYDFDINSALETVNNTEMPLSPTVKRLIWLKNAINNNNFRDMYNIARAYRRKTGCLQPVELLVIAEGVTEEVLLPVFSKVAGVDFFKNGVKLLSAGGKNRALKLYKKMSQAVKLPIIILLDADASCFPDMVDLRENDHIYILSDGEFEDILPDELICRAVNRHYRLTGIITPGEISRPKAHALAELYREKGFGEFRKAEFAEIIADSINNNTPLSAELEGIFHVIRGKLGLDDQFCSQNSIVERSC